MRQRSMRGATPACVLAVGILSALSVVFGLPTGATAAVSTDQPTYAPGSTVTVSGDNSDGAGYLGGETVDVSVSGPGEAAYSCSAVAGGSGAWSCQVTLSSGASAVGSYAYTATGRTSGVSQEGSFGDSGCPNSHALGNQLEDPNVAASYTAAGGVATYSLTSPNESPTGGIPGLIEYCVYTESPNSTTAVYSNLQGAWTTGSGGGYFDFERSDGNPDNVPFDGTTHTIGKAMWNSGKVPAAQTIVLHINDTAECSALYGGTTETCFVLPSHPAAPASPLEAEKTANAAFTRTYTWGIGKTSDKTEIEGKETATFNYTVSVTHDSGTDSDWEVSGVIYVTNPNGAAVSGVNITDAIDPSATCTVVGGSSATIPAENTSEFSYSCSYSAKPAKSSETNTATVKWGAQQLANGSTLSAGSTTATAAVDWSSTTPTIVDGSVSVTDTLAGLLGTVSYADTSPTTFKYSHSFTDPPQKCTKHENTATVTTNTTGTTGSASATVTHCRSGGKIRVTCTSVTFTFSGFPNKPNNTVKETIKIDGVVVYVGTYSFNGSSGTNTVPITVPPGHHVIGVKAIWNTNGAQYESDYRPAKGITCS